LPAAARQRRTQQQPAPPPPLSLRRLFLLTIVTAAFAFALQAILAVSRAPAGEAIILLVIPVAAAAVIFFGLRPYPTTGRVRLAVMVGMALFLLGLIL
jgi:hypothetical protein